MLRIKTQWGVAIIDACRYSSVLPEFLAALIAGESGGDPAAKRFEKSVYNKLISVQRGYAAHYGALSSGDLKPLNDDAIRDLATSWGLTQVMGYHVARRPGGIAILKDPATHLKFALGLMGGFAERFQLNVKAEFAEMFRCWNTGKPYGETFDPKYVERGLARIEIYKRGSGVGSRESA